MGLWDRLLGRTSRGNEKKRPSIDASRVRVDPKGELREEEKAILAHLALLLELTCPASDEAWLAGKIQEEFGLDKATAEWYVRQSVHAYAATRGKRD